MKPTYIFITSTLTAGILLTLNGASNLSYTLEGVHFTRLIIGLLLMTLALIPLLAIDGSSGRHEK